MMSDNNGGQRGFGLVHKGKGWLDRLSLLLITPPSRTMALHGGRGPGMYLHMITVQVHAQMLGERGWGKVGK